MSERRMVRLKCDRCGLEVYCDSGDGSRANRPKGWEALINNGAAAGSWPKDFCPKCMGEFMAFLEAGKPKS